MTHELRETIELGFNIAQIAVSLLLVFVLLFQVTGGGLGGIFGEQETVFRTRRGITKALFRSTIVLSVLFVVFAIARVGLPQGEAKVNLAAPPYVAENSEFGVDVTVKSIEDDFAYAQFEVSFDDSVLRLHDVTAGTMNVPEAEEEVSTTIYGWGETVSGEAGKYTVLAAVEESVAGASGSLAQLHFSVVGAAGDSAHIRLSEGTLLATDLYSSERKEVVAGWGGDTVKVRKPESGMNVGVAAPSQVTKESDFVAEVNVTEITDGINRAEFDVSFESSVLRLDGVDSGTIGDTGTAVSYSQKKDSSGAEEEGKYTVVVDVPDVTGSGGVLAQLRFHVVDTTGGVSSNIELSSGVLGNYDSVNKAWTETRESSWSVNRVVSQSWPKVTVSSSSSSVTQGSDFKANAYITRVVDRIDKAEFEVTFDESVLELTSVTFGTIQNADASKEKETKVVSWERSEPGKWTIVVKASVDTGDTGSLAVLHFRVVGSVDSTSGIELSSGTLTWHGEEREATWSGTTVTVKAAS